MAEKTTTHFALPYPTSAGEVKLGATDIEELALKLDEVLFEKLAGTWTALEEVSAKIETASGSRFTPAVRLDVGGTIARLRGAWKVKAGEASGTKLAKLPAGFRPTKVVAMPFLSTDVPVTTPFLAGLLIGESGEIQTVAEIPEKRNINLDGITWSVT